MELEQALQEAQQNMSHAGGIGTLREKTLHATLKRWLDEDESHYEVPLPSGHVADIFDGESVTEIQTAGFSVFRKKLETLLEEYDVTVVHPVIRSKWLIWVDPATGEPSTAHKSPRTGTFADAGKELIFILPLLTHPRLTVRLVLVDVEEWRLADGWSKQGKRGSHRVERFPKEVVEEAWLTAAEDYAAMMPKNLSVPFTAEQFGKAAHLSGRHLYGTLKVMTEVGFLTRKTDKRPYEYTIRKGENAP